MNSPQSRPGAYCVRGGSGNAHVDDVIHDNNDETQNDEPAIVTVQVPGEVVNEEEERKRQQRMVEQEARRINEFRENLVREAQSRLEYYEQQPTAHATPAEESDDSSKTSDTEQRDTQEYGAKAFFRIALFAGLVVVIALMVLLFLLGVVGGKGSGSKSVTVSRAPSIEPSSMSPSLSPLESDDSWVQLGDTDTLKGEAAGDRFGLSVALSMDGSVLAALGRLGNVRAFRYDRDASQWDQLGQSIDLEGEHGSVALSTNGRTVAAISTPENSYGRVHVFTLDVLTNVWSNAGVIAITEGGFGLSVDLSGDGEIIAASATGRDDDSDYFSGLVQVHRYNATTDQWHQMGQTLRGVSPGDWFGYSVSLSTDGSIVAIGAPARDAAVGFVRVYTYLRSEDQWAQLGNDLEGLSVEDWFGQSVALSANGRVLVSGGPSDDSNGGASGFVRAHQYSVERNQWNQRGQDIFGAPLDNVGLGVDLSADGMVMAVGSPSNSRLVDQPGFVQMFRYNISTVEWTQFGPAIVGENIDDHFGWSVALSAEGDIVAAGSFGRDVNASGYVGVFNRSEHS